MFKGKKGQQIAPLLSGPSGVDSTSRDADGEQDLATSGRVEVRLTVCNHNLMALLFQLLTSITTG